MSLAACSASAGSVAPWTRYGPVGGTAEVTAAAPAGEATKARNFLTASRCSVDLAAYTAAGSQMVAPLVAALSPGIPKKPMSLATCGDFFNSGGSTRERMGKCAPLP